MTKMKKIIIGAFFSVVTLGGLVAVAGPGHHGKFGGMSPEKAERIVERVSGKLDLNEVQKQNLNTLKDTVLELKSKNQPKENRLDMVKGLLAAPVLDESAILAKIQERTSMMNQASPQVVTALANFTNSLNDEQRAKIVKFAEKMSKKRGKRYSH